MIKVLFVCHGNICRSVMAEYVFRHMAGQAGAADRFFVDSAAVSREEIGNAIYPPARRELQQRGVPIGSHRARQITKQDLQKFDRIYYMDSSNARYLARLFPGQKGFAPLLDRDVADPWYTGNFTQTYQDVTEGCRAILEEFGVSSL